MHLEQMQNIRCCCSSVVTRDKNSFPQILSGSILCCFNRRFVFFTQVIDLMNNNTNNNSRQKHTSTAGDGLRPVPLQGHLCVREDDGAGGNVPLDGAGSDQQPALHRESRRLQLRYHPLGDLHQGDPVRGYAARSGTLCQMCDAYVELVFLLTKTTSPPPSDTLHLILPLSNLRSRWWRPSWGGKNGRAFHRVARRLCRSSCRRAGLTIQMNGPALTSLCRGSRVSEQRRTHLVGGGWRVKT